MKIQFYGQNCFEIKNKDANMIFDPNEKVKGKSSDFATNSGNFNANFNLLKEVKKTLELPGEFEISGVLVRGFFSDENKKNVVYKVFMDDIAVVHFGNLSQKPKTEFFEQLGENIDVVVLNISEAFDAKAAKDLIETIDARLTLIGGDQSLFPKMVESGARISEENPVTLSRTMLNEEKTDILILTEA